eukprot:m.125147 g.125147  ORF g.125147 m.125147 type:complete len:106 (+) comp13527_c0_seq1:2609-2926(+)
MALIANLCTVRATVVFSPFAEVLPKAVPPIPAVGDLGCQRGLLFPPSARVLPNTGPLVEAVGILGCSAYLGQRSWCDCCRTSLKVWVIRLVAKEACSAHFWRKAR